MRIIAGSLGGRRLRTVEGEGYRPAMGRTRESLFSMLEARGLNYDGLAALDLYAGSGSLAFEALSRGASEAVLVENSRPAMLCLEQNREDLGLQACSRLVQQDVGRFLRGRRDGSYGLVFIDPPYGRNLARPALLGLLKYGWLAPGALVAAELEQGMEIRLPDQLTPAGSRVFGQTVLHIWKLA